MQLSVASLAVDSKQRPTAAQALSSPFFESMQAQVEGIQKQQMLLKQKRQERRASDENRDMSNINKENSSQYNTTSNPNTLAATDARRRSSNSSSNLTSNSTSNSTRQVLPIVSVAHLRVLPIVRCCSSSGVANRQCCPL
jgi:hypothetical protein